MTFRKKETCYEHSLFIFSLIQCTSTHHTSDFIENFPYTIASGAVHFTGNREPCFGQYSSSAITRASPKSKDEKSKSKMRRRFGKTIHLPHIFATLFSPIRTFRAAKSLCINSFVSKYSMPEAICDAI